jgi:hypothetical protein
MTAPSDTGPDTTDTTADDLAFAGVARQGDRRPPVS